MRRAKAAVVLAMLSLFASSISAENGQTSKPPSSEEILNRKAATSSNDRTINALTRALSTAGVPGGIATLIGCREDVRYAFPSYGASLEDALNAIVATDSQYRWRVENGLINVSQRSGDPLFLAFRISRVKVIEARSLDDALSEILALPEVQRRLLQLHMSEGYRRIGLSDLTRTGNVPFNKQRYSISLRNVTLREGLNALARLHGRAVWEYRERHCNGMTEFQIQFLVS